MFYEQEGIVMDIVDKIMAFESGEMDYEETISFFQELIDDGTAWTLQGSYGRAAESLIAGGQCTRPARFSIQRHFAETLHYDLRLEREGVLESWSVPEGLPEEPGDIFTGVKVDSRDNSFIDFDGMIPEGEYGAGVVELVDIGEMKVHRWDLKYIKVTLRGKVYNGTWSLRNTKGKNWLIRASKP